jgi:uncharacterized protein (DUF58 family)
MSSKSITRSAGPLLSRIGLLAIFAGLLLAAWYGNTAVSVILGLVLAAAAITRGWSRLSLRRVSCERSLSEQRAFPGEYLDLQFRLVNRKLLPLPWIHVDNSLPRGFSEKTASSFNLQQDYGIMSKSLSLLWYSAVSWKEKLYCHKRGYYKLGRLTVTSGDIFGFYPRSLSAQPEEYVIVYPALYSIHDLGIPPLYPMGETKIERRLFEDPTRVAGVRDYRSGDSLRHIHWKATARRQGLQIKVFEPTTSQNLALFISIDSFIEEERVNEGDYELALSTAASVACDFIQRSTPVGLFVNTRQADTGQPVRLLPGSGTGQLVSVLESLAKATSSSSQPFNEFLIRHAEACPGERRWCLYWRISQRILLQACAH